MSCPHSKVYHSIEHDNFYCSDCKQGMGRAFYDAMVALEAVSAGIWRENGACGLAGAAVTVQLVEKALKHLDKYNVKTLRLPDSQKASRATPNRRRQS